ncbi:MAG TPA: NAD(P)-dependent oxidoreductase [Vicinamibacterales bacterium]|nr:NAD(P)-dependent oxidoreductase [Vicinamibacterales bacterium]
MRVVVFGATGVIGRRTVPLMIREGHRVTAVGRSPDRLRGLASQGATTIALDLFDREAIRRAVAGQEAIANLATAIPRSGLGMFFRRAWKETDRIREHFSALLVDEALAAGARAFIQESFAPIYVDAGDRWVTEADATRPVRYNQTTLKAEASAERFARQGGRGVVLRFAYFYGPNDRFTEDVFRYAARGWLPLLGSLDAYFSTCHHDDAATAVVAALNIPSGTYNVVDNEPMTHWQFGEALSAISGVPVPKPPPQWLVRLTGSMGETMARSLRISSAKLRQSGWTPQHASARKGWESVYQSLKFDQ